MLVNILFQLIYLLLKKFILDWETSSTEEKTFLTMFGKISFLAKIKVTAIWQDSTLFRNAWPIFFVLYWGTPG